MTLTEALNRITELVELTDDQAARIEVFLDDLGYTAYQEGYDTGHNEGYNEGYDVGHYDGLEGL